MLRPSAAAVLLGAAIALVSGSVLPAQSRIKVVLVTGQSNQYHNWEVSSPIVKRLLEDSGRFAVTVATTPPKGAAPNQDMSSFAPKFSDFQAVVLDYEGFEFAPPVKQAFVDYVKNGGGLVVLHAADNAFPGWAEYNEMIGVGGWGGFTPGYASRTQAAGPKIRWRDGKMVLDNDTPGTAQHPAPYDYRHDGSRAGSPDHEGSPAGLDTRQRRTLQQSPRSREERDGSRDSDGADVYAERHWRERAHRHGHRLRQGACVSRHARPRGSEAEGTYRADAVRGLYRPAATRHRMGRDRRGDDSRAARLSDRRQDVAQVSAKRRRSRFP